MKRLQTDYTDIEKKIKFSTSSITSKVFIKNDLDKFREQKLICSSDSNIFYQTKPLVSSDEQDEITKNIDNTLPIEYQSWENSIIYHSNTSNPSKTDEIGWIPTRECRTLATYQKEILGHNIDFIEHPRLDERGRAVNWYSIFPMTDSVILKNLMENKDFLFDLNYKPKCIIPEQDLTVNELPVESSIVPLRKERPVTIHSNKNSLKNNKENRLHRTRNVLARAGLMGVLPEEQTDNHRNKYKENVKTKTVGFWNISNDCYYDPTNEPDFLLKRRINSSQNLDFVFYPVFRTINELRYFHRPLLETSSEKFDSWLSIQLSNVEINSIRTKFDLTAKYGDILLFEYSEQYPVLLNEIGMFSKIRTYLRPQHFKADTSSYEVDYGELIYTHASPFLWSIPRGLNVQTIENNMFIAPVYRQISSPQDFLIIYNRKTGFFIRNLNSIYLLGQQCPLIEVPIPQSKRVNLYQRDLLQIYIYRLFLQSTENPKRIRIEDIKRVFPRLAESSIRKRLKTSADFRRTGKKGSFSYGFEFFSVFNFFDDCNSWILRNDVRLPTEDELRDLIKPEFCCAYASMTAAEQRLKDAGFCDKSNFDYDEDDDDNEQSNYSSELNEEILQAPWNITRAYLGALKGKYSMQVFGIGAKTVQKTKTKHDLKHFRRAVTGTDADLRRLQLKDARKLLLKFNISEKIIQTLTRWEIVDLVRTLSTQQAKEGNTGGIIKFARGVKHFQAQQFEKYKENCQKQFEIQNQLFTCTDEQSTDEDTSDENHQILDEMSQTLENLLRENPPTFITHERPKLLHITRTYIDNQGQSYQKEEFIRNNDSLIQAYMKIRQTKTDQFIKAYYSLDENEREILKRERRRLQEQLRRVKRNEVRYNQYEKQQMLFKIQQENLALIQSIPPPTSSTIPSTTVQHSNSYLSDLQLNLSEDEDNSSSL